MPFSVNNRVGRLVEFRALAQLSPEQMPAFIQSVREGLSQRKGKVVVICDLRPLTVMHPAVADRTAELLRSDNPLVERAGYILGSQAIVGLQLERIVRESKHEHRKTFRATAALLAFLAPALTAAEQRRAQVFLAEWSSDPGSSAG